MAAHASNIIAVALSDLMRHRAEPGIYMYARIYSHVCIFPYVYSVAHARLYSAVCIFCHVQCVFHRTCWRIFCRVYILCILYILPCLYSATCILCYVYILPQGVMYKAGSQKVAGSLAAGRAPATSQAEAKRPGGRRAAALKTCIRKRSRLAETVRRQARDFFLHSDTLGRMATRGEWRRGKGGKSMMRGLGSGGGGWGRVPIFPFLAPTRLPTPVLKCLSCFYSASAAFLMLWF